ncbi:MAG: metallophosphoesterase family protein [Bryobacteraceae bacterium]
MRFLSSLLLIAVGAVIAYTSSSNGFHFVILGDRTGRAVPGVYDEAWREADRDHPAFVISVGDTIEGGNDLTIDTEWRQILHLLAPYHRYRLFLTPGNHDVWSAGSAQAFEKYSKRPLHYSFDYGQAHFTVLDNSRSDDMPAEELAYLQNDLQIHQKQPVKFVFSHRPSWILQVVLGNPEFRLQRLAKRYGVGYVIAGHIHEMLHFKLDTVTYLSMPSSGGHLRGSKRYEDGWFFQHTLVTVQGKSVNFKIKELDPPFGRSRITQPADWGSLGLHNR